ncbi:hypothetical protein [Treponema zioleckii]|uniref:hypothetical protein n=1 Tax=Treponema zioleckii TaxID=331680 RepID=UPI00168AF316|nr:hypothetical protein [Treponema zioleckii]
MDEVRSLVDFDTWDRSFHVEEQGRYKVTATIFSHSLGTGTRPDIVDVSELYFEARDDSDAEIVKLSTFEKCAMAISYADFREAFKNLGLDIATVAVTVVALVGIGVILKKIPAGRVKPLLMKLARKLKLSKLLTFLGTAGDAFDVVALIESICSFYEQASNARNREHLKAAGKTFERIVKALGLFAVFDFMTSVGTGMKKADVENEIKALDDVPKKNVESSVEDARAHSYYQDKEGRWHRPNDGSKGKGFASYDELEEFGLPVPKTNKKVYTKTDYAAGTPEHKAVRWKDYQENGGELSYEKWSEKYETAIKNQKAGAKFEKDSFEKFCEKYHDAQTQVEVEFTLESGKKVTLKLDAVGLDDSGNIVIQEYKSSLSAGFTENQTAIYDGYDENPKLLFDGVITNVKGKWGTKIKKIPKGTKVNVIRPGDEI